ncbi:DoxX family protein [Sinomicrobium weinanense]|uniref:DoxX family protein n=1 Tax=Sinomicrobium weinanense TaxID=2842200 RepID=A0A926Q3R2_9FLAO|nr:DoxX family protein [Sinomicrobium weinanense]MBC9797828.1 DoxX family protein [Sinomicrobium weinanense]MBU3124663.1 DoxX family protein [Sinomicrobium weinanense]
METSKKTSKKMFWTGRIISILLILFLLLDAIMKIVKATPAVEGSIALGYPESAVVPMGIILLICTIFYIVPRTSILGAILLTGYLGGATTTHFRVGEPVWFAVIFGILVWLALYFCDERLRTLIPFRKKDTDRNDNTVE